MDQAMTEASESAIDLLSRAMLAGYTGWYALPCGGALFLDEGRPLGLTDNGAGPDGPSEADLLTEAREATGIKCNIVGEWIVDDASGARVVVLDAPGRVFS